MNPELLLIELRVEELLLEAYKEVEADYCNQYNWQNNQVILSEIEYYRQVIEGLERKIAEIQAKIIFLQDKI
jgi:hypothetical protein